MKVTLLLLEDDDGLRSSLEKSFRRKGHNVLAATRVEEAKRILAQRQVDLMLLDLRLPDGSGLEVLAFARELDEQVEAIMMTAFPEVKTAVRAMKEGARDFVIKPFELDELHLTVERVVEALELRRRVRRLERERLHHGEVDEMLGKSPAIQQVREDIRKVAGTDAPVLIVGETGTGKELVADSVHRLSERSKGPLVKVNCSAFSEQLLESELFGHEKGAFTDAREARPGLFEMADGGTVLLDEISEMKPELQAKLLRVVEGQPFRRVGGRRDIAADVRVIAATNRDLQVMVEEMTFRQDLYYRLNVFQIKVPPLRDRERDATLLAEFFVQRFVAALRKSTLVLSPEASEILHAYAWPGNVRELRNVIERAVILAENRAITAQHLPGELRAAAFVRRHAQRGAQGPPTLDEIERRYIAQILEQVGGNISEAARVLGIARNTLKAKLPPPESG
ncbi:MAG: sigma-54-dependent transcriptional regulator [Thermoanaerobaculia bacterium]